MRTLWSLCLLSGLAFADGSLPPLWGEGKTLGQKIELEEAHVCADAKGHVLVIDRVNQQYYGDRTTLSVVINQNALRLFDPRQANELARADWDRSMNKCVIQCGERTLQLEPMEASAASALLLSAKFVASPNTRVPHALLRDPKGNYYYVDRGRAQGEEKNFRLFVGPRGALKLQKMTNVVSDSAGEIFTTKSGDLRLLVDREKTSEWVERGRKTALRQVPLDENLHLIYAELGVYTGQRLGTPCDDL